VIERRFVREVGSTAEDWGSGDFLRRRGAAVGSEAGERSRFLRGARIIEEVKQHGGLGTEPCGSVLVRGRGQLGRGLQTLGGFGFHDLDHPVLTQLTPSRLRDADTERRLLKGQATKLGFLHGHRLGVVQRAKSCPSLPGALDAYEDVETCR
jgi:hypothetical protein